jgi:hypothetical protein
METYGVPWEDIAPKDRKAAWKGLEEQMSFVDAWYAENGSDAIWIMGDKPTFIDFVGFFDRRSFLQHCRFNGFIGSCWVFRLDEGCSA